MYFSVFCGELPAAIRHSRIVRSDVPGFSRSGSSSVDPGILKVAHHQPLVAIEHAQTLRHVLERGVEAHVLETQFGLALPQRAGAVSDRVFEAAVELIEFLDHQRYRPVGAPPVAVALLKGGADELSEQADIDLAGRLRRFRKLLGEKFVHFASSCFVERGHGQCALSQFARRAPK